MGLGDALKSAANFLTREGWVSGSSFPYGSYIHFSADPDGEKAIRITYPKNAGEFLITHDMVKYAACIAIGPIGLRNEKGVNAVIYGAKYRFELNDGKTGVLTCNTDRTSLVEHILF